MDHEFKTYDLSEEDKDSAMNQINKCSFSKEYQYFKTTRGFGVGDENLKIHIYQVEVKYYQGFADLGYELCNEGQLIAVAKLEKTWSPILVRPRDYEKLISMFLDFNPGWIEGPFWFCVFNFLDYSKKADVERLKESGFLKDIDKHKISYLEIKDNFLILKSIRDLSIEEANKFVRFLMEAKKNGL